MKRLLCCMLVMMLVLSMAGCAKEDSKNDSGEKNSQVAENSTGNGSGSDEDSEDAEDDATEDTQESDEIRENGKLPEDEDELTDEEKRYYKDQLIPAVINLDMKVLEEYLEEDSYELMQEIYEDEEFRDMYLKTIGQTIYLAESQAFVTKDIEYVYAKWYTDQYEANAEIVDDVRELSRDQVKDAYEKYYANAPYTTGEVGGLRIKIEEGYIKFDIGSLFKYVHVYNMDTLDPSLTYDGDRYACLIFGDDAGNMNLGYDYINEDGDFGIWESVYEFDIDKMIAYTEQNPDVVSTGLYKDYLEEYYKNPENRKIIEDWVAENCEIYRDLSWVYIYWANDVEREYPYKNYTDAEKEMIKDLNLGKQIAVYDNAAWGGFFEIVEWLKDLDVLQ